MRMLAPPATLFAVRIDTVSWPTPPTVLLLLVRVSDPADERCRVAAVGVRVKALLPVEAELSYFTPAFEYSSTCTIAVLTELGMTMSVMLTPKGLMLASLRSLMVIFLVAGKTLHSN